MYERILVPVDGSATSERALQEAVKLARLTGGRLCLLHVVDPLGHINGFEAPAIYWQELQPALIKAGEALVAEAKTKAGADDLSVDTKVIESGGQRVSEVIVEKAVEWNADLLVLGTHGRRGIERVMVGSDAEQVVRTAPVPVLLVRHPG